MHMHDSLQYVVIVASDEKHAFLDTLNNSWITDCRSLCKQLIIIGSCLGKLRHMCKNNSIAMSIILIISIIHHLICSFRPCTHSLQTPAQSLYETNEI